MWYLCITEIVFYFSFLAESMREMIKSIIKNTVPYSMLNSLADGYGNIKKIYYHCTSTLFAKRKYQLEEKKCMLSNYTFHNFRETSADGFWITRFIEHRKLNPKGRKLDFFSVWGSRKAFQYSSSPKVVFFGEYI
jgi:hypothetical protein